MTKLLLLLLAAPALLLACASTTPGSRPTDMSAASHEQEAKRHDELASKHAAQYDTTANEQRVRCRGSVAVTAIAEPCWTSVTNPTRGHLEEADRHHRMASDHRNGSESLRKAEAGACVGLSAADRDTSPFDHREDVARVDPLQSVVSTAKGGAPLTRIDGASVTVRAVPGLTREYLERLVACHLARNASMGFAMPEMASCPLSVKSASASVDSVEGGFRVNVRGEDGASAQEILARAKRLVSAP